MLALFIAPESIIFSSALALMVALGLIEALGLGASGLDVDLHVDHDLLGWLGVGQVPLMVVLIAFLAVFGGLGLAGQQLVSAATGAPMSPWVAVPATFALSLPATAAAARLLARVMPHDETTAFELDDLVGRADTITLGRAAWNHPARARVIDPHGQAHHVLVEPNDPAATFQEGDEVLLVRRESGRFRAILHATPRYSNWIES